MKIVKLDTKHKLLRGIVVSIDDLLLLRYIIEKGDQITAFSRRKIDVNGKKEVKRVKIGVEVESVNFTGSSLEVSGRIFYSSDEEIPLHKYHTITLNVRDGFSLQKSRFLSFQAKLIEDSRKKTPKIFICVYELGHAIFYTLTNFSLKKKYEINEDIGGKQFKNQGRATFMSHLVDALNKEFNRRKWDLFIVAGNSLGNADIRSNMGDKGIHYETVSYADTGIKELVSKDRINELLRQNQIARQKKLIDEYIDGIGRMDKRYVYGEAEILRRMLEEPPVQALVTGEAAVEKWDLVSRLDEAGAEVVLFLEEDDSKAILNGFGGVMVKFE